MEEMGIQRTKAIHPFGGRGPAEDMVKLGTSAAESGESKLYHDKGIIRTTEVRIS